MDPLTLGEWQVVEGGRGELIVPSIFLPLPEPGRRSAGQRPAEAGKPSAVQDSRRPTGELSTT